MDEGFAVELRNVTKQFGNVTAVDHINLRIQNGEFFSLLGPSGCGKTTTLRMIGGFEMPTQGEVAIAGEVQGFKPPFKRPVNTVFQNYALFPHMNVSQNVAFGLQMQKVSKDDIHNRVEETLELVRLPGMGSRKPNQLSGGQQQRVALARALINQPKLLLLDEPLGALDLKLRKTMQLELKDLQQRVGITFIYVTHDQEEALTMSDRIAVMNQGEVLQIGHPEQIYEHPASRFVADFIGETNFMSGKVARINADTVEIVVDNVHNISVPKSGTVSQGQEVTIAVRPEKIMVVNGSRTDTQLQATVEEVIYIGTDIRYNVRISEQTLLVIREQNSGGETGKRFQRGEQIRIGWLDENASLLTE
jgi:spermidine/putrescine transport system ATP-binding protein